MDRKVSSINPDLLHWLLEKKNPSVRYYTLTDLLGKAENEAEVIAARKAIMDHGMVPYILSQQQPDGNWSAADRFYTDKYRGTVWQLLILAELGADGNHPGIRKACEFILQTSQDPDSFAFSYRKRAKESGGLHSEVIPCLTGNMIWSLIRLGNGSDHRVQAGIQWIISYQRSDDGIDVSPAGWPYDRYQMCWGKHSCHMGVVKSLKALAAIPADNKSPEVISKIGELAEYLLIHRIHKKSHELKKVSRPGWRKFGYPLMYQTDILEILEILISLGYKDQRMAEALEIVKQKQGIDGRWKMENSYNGRFIQDVEVLRMESKWITLKALKVLFG
ncbi:MAG: nitrogen fixation protein NifH [Bacteroidetes bacterium]|nr:nitrogen fixation protein NifH [Bacteroidota bacterium]